MKITVLPGDGIGPEVIEQALLVLDLIAKEFGHDFATEIHEIGGESLRSQNTPLPSKTLDAALSSDAVLLGAVGAPEFNSLPQEKKPESGLLTLRKAMGTYANLRPVKTYPSLEKLSPVKLHQKIDFVIVRELTGGLYFGEPRFRKRIVTGQRVALNTLVYDEHEITRIAHIAFRLARKRKKRLTSVDKANVLETSQLWRDVVNETAIAYPDVTVEHIYVDNCAMQLMLRPETFDVILTENMFGDILSDEAAVLTGSLGMLPSASLNESRGLYEPVHGSAPDIAGKSLANPVGAIVSVAMMLRHSFNLEQEASLIEEAVKNVIEAGVRTADIADKEAVSTTEFGQQVCSQIKKEIKQLNVVTV